MQQAPPPKLELAAGMDSAAALPAQARPVSHSGPLETDYPACGVPQCIMAATKPRVVIPGRLWEVRPPKLLGARTPVMSVADACALGQRCCTALDELVAAADADKVLRITAVVRISHVCGKKCAAGQVAE